VSKHLLILTLAAVSLAVGCTQKAAQVAPTVALDSKTFARQWATDLQGGGGNSVTAVYPVENYVFVYRQDGTSTVIDRTSGQLLHIDSPRGGGVRMHPPVLLKDRIVYPTTTYLEVYDVGGRYIPHPMRPTDESDKPFSQDLRFAIRSDAVGTGKFLFFGADFRSSGRAVEVDMTRPYVPDVWTLMTPGSSVSAAPVLSKDSVFIASEDGKVTAVTTESRSPVWSSTSNGMFETFGGVVANLVLDASGLYVASTDTKLYCMHEKSGRVNWQFYAGQPLRSEPALTKDLVYQAVPGRGLAALEKSPPSQLPASSSSNKAPRWIAPDAVKFLSSDDTYAYAATADNHIVALDKKTGEPQFTSRRNDFARFGVNLKGDGLIYVADNNSRVMSVRPVLRAGSVGEIVMVPAAAAAEPTRAVAMGR